MDHSNSAVVDVTLLMIADRPVTKDGLIGCVMFHISGEDDTSRWFDYRPGVMSPAIRIVWDKDSMEAILPADTALSLISRGYARFMTTSEAEAFNARLPEEPTNRSEGGD